MKKKAILATVLVFTLFAGVFLGTYADENLIDISAVINQGIQIVYNGNVQTLTDANGNQVYPISYNGSTYVPIRAVSGIFGQPVNWDAANNQVILGTPPSSSSDSAPAATSTSDKGVDLTVNSFKEYPGDTIEADYPDVPAVQNGYKWVLVDATLTNGTSDTLGDGDFGDIALLFTMLDSDGYEHFVESVYMRYLGDTKFDLTPMDPGQTRSGKLLFTLKSECQTYTFCFQPYWGTKVGTLMQIKLK